MPGFVGLKLLNISSIKTGRHPSVWETAKWDAILDYCGKVAKPVLWHVTQRVTDCPYMGGGDNSYWKDGRAKQPKGKRYGNTELLDAFIKRISAHCDTRFIGAHHLHIGPDKAAKLLKKHPNLNLDYSCGNIVRPGDSMYEDDRNRWRKYTLKFSDRLLFGTDCMLGANAGLWYLWETLEAPAAGPPHPRTSTDGSQADWPRAFWP